MIEVTLYIIADKRSNEQFAPDEISKNLEDLYSTLEYGDVLEGECQIWEYPSGKIFDMRPDREVPKSKYYSTPAENSWMPELTLVSTDTQKVEEARKKLV